MLNRTWYDGPASLMSFDSSAYAVFLALVLAVYWRLGHERQNWFLTLASLFFYGWWDWRFLALLGAAILIDYELSRRIARGENENARKGFLLASVALNLTVLGFFKYFNFFSESLLSAVKTLGFDPGWTFVRVLLPIGVSFYTFEAIAYMVDVYRRRMPPARSLRDYALFITFFPHLIAGPIMRPRAFLPQCEKPRVFRRRRFVNGLDLIAWGMVKKLFIADGIAYYADRLFALHEPSTLLVAVAGIGFWLQILADFSGYTDIARGSAKLLGFELARNFRAPYLARSIGEFWRRWHISLSSWIRDYVYIPLGGSRVSRGRWIVNVLVTWTLCGLWHGAAWKFLLWGFYHGALIVAERGRRAGGIVATNALIIAGWILFRTPSLDRLASYVSVEALVRSPYDAQVALILMAVFTFYSLPWIAKALWDRRRATLRLTPAQKREARGLWYAAASVLLLLFAKLHSSAFIYFEF